MHRFHPLLAVLVLSACGIPEGLRSTPEGSGPMVTVDWDAEPLPELPFPNDLGTRPDPNSPTGLRLNISLVADTHHQSEDREKLNQLSGWGVFSPITVGFRAPLDIDNLATRHALDLRPGDQRLDNDAIFVIDVTPDSPTFGEAAAIDIGEGRFPMDVWGPHRYFENDTRAEHPSIVLDTVDEDLNGNGKLDWGEDTDNDGHLDVPNVWPADSDDVFADLLSWYERESNTIIIRPAVPLREETTYAVVVTERVVDPSGAPVRSPWDYIHHLRQTESLSPLVDVLPDFGLSIDDVAFTWSFTTGQVTRELVEIRRGLDGDGPLSFLADEVPVGVRTAQVLHEQADKDVHQLAMVDLMEAMELVGELADPLIIENYNAFGDRVVGGTFSTPDFLVDKDDGGRDDSEEVFDIDLEAQTAVWAQREVTFTCLLPTAHVSEPPFDVVMWGHGYGSSRIEFATFVWAVNRVGKAACAFDFPGHGLQIHGDELELTQTVLESLDLLPFLNHLEDDRARDLDNDGNSESGGDQWSADAFHTRDQVRQAVVDWMSFSRSLRDCGNGTMTRDGDGASATTCDWDGDGSPDIGGPNTKLYVVGGSLGGINASVAAGVMPEVTAFVPLVSGAGLLDIGLRSDIRGALEAMVGRLVTPMFVGRPQDDGSLDVIQVVNSVTSMRDLHVARVPEWPAGGRVVVENLTNDIVRTGYLPEDGTFRIHIPADGARPAQKRELSGMPEAGAIGLTPHIVEDNLGLGDRIRVRLQTAEGEDVVVLDSFENDVLHEGVTMPAGSPLVAGSYGSGYIRSTPDVRRVASLFSAILEPGDPVAYSPLHLLRPIEDLGGQPTNILHMPHIGDNIVSINTGISQARAMGLIGNEEIDPRYGMSVDHWLIDRRVVHGIEERGPYVCNDGQPCLFDPDDLDGDIDPYGEPSDEPLRAEVETESGVSGLRLGYPDPGGDHGVPMPDPEAEFQPVLYLVSLVAGYIHFDGQMIPDDECMVDMSCEWFPPLPPTEEDN
ncbi:MAG: hypothetical protein VX498_06310 [Myxococcota bacterium]|nr:hypothetical protein [Myxococcota bacterium]